MRKDRFKCRQYEQPDKINKIKMKKIYNNKNTQMEIKIFE